MAGRERENQGSSGTSSLATFAIAGGTLAVGILGAAAYFLSKEEEPPARNKQLQSNQTRRVAIQDTIKNENKQEQKKPEAVQCTICYKIFTDREAVLHLSCAHKFHINCVLSMLKVQKSCPVCRKELSDEDVKAYQIGMD